MELKNIKNPQDIKSLSIEELKQLAEQMRHAILYRTSSIGGHVGPNLGAVEAMTAMHYVFDAPRDKIVIDVSHQDFPHKMLTGRAYGFLSPEGFAKIGEYTEPSESPEYDLFYAGHTSPAISLCVGLARARELASANYRIVAFVGDGALSGGEALEGLNQGADVKGSLVIIFNDNQMAIAPDSGGMYAKLAELRATAGTAEDNIFKSFGWEYLYVADGNDMGKCIGALEKARDMNRPVVVHINTQKGEGYAPAEKDREAFHWRPPFVEESGADKKSAPEPNYMTLTRDFLLNKCRTVPNFLVVTAATPADFGFLAKERMEAGSHFIDVGIAEQTAVSVMAGAARAGAKVVLGITGSFMQRAYDQMIEDWAMNDSPATMLVFDTGVNGIRDQTHLGFWDIPFVTSMPDIVYLAPSSMEEYMEMLEWSVAQDKYKVAIRVPTYSVWHHKGTPDKDYSDLNKFKMEEKGTRVALIGAGDYFPKALEVAELLKAEGIEPTVINPRFISGVDTEMLLSLQPDHEVVATIEDGSIEGGFGQRVAGALGGTPLKVLNFGLKKEFADRYEVEALETEQGLLPSQIAASILNII